MVGIYVIKNNINGKCYVGQSKNVHKRILRHKRVWKNPSDRAYDYPLYCDIRQYGIENFTFELLEECSEDMLNEREIYWISKLDSYYGGYNQTEGGDHSGHPIKINKYQLQYITLELKNSDMVIQEIADKRHVSYEMVQGINTGRFWHRDNIEYPIRKHNVSKRIAHYKKYHSDYKQKPRCVNCGTEISNGAKYCLKCYLESLKIGRPSKYELIKLMLNNSKEAIGRMYNLSGNAIKKWCIGYGIPFKKQDLIQYISDNNIIIE